MQRPGSVQQSKVVVAELERQRRREKKTKEGVKMIKTLVPIYKGVDIRHARESRRPKSSYGYMDASVFRRFIKISIN